MGASDLASHATCRGAHWYSGTHCDIEPARHITLLFSMHQKSANMALAVEHNALGRESTRQEAMYQARCLSLWCKGVVGVVASLTAVAAFCCHILLALLHY